MDAGDGREVMVLPVGAGSKLNGDAYGAITWSPDGAMIAVAAWGKPVEFWEIATGQRRCKVEGDGDAGTCVAFSEAAATELARLGESAGPAMREALRTVTSDEVRGRLTILLGRLAERGPASPEALRARRGIEVLERIGTAGAREVLARLARERPGSVVSGLAKGAVGRLSSGE